MRPYHSDMDNLNQYMTELKTSSPAMAQTLEAEVGVINQRWSLLLKEFGSREVGFSWFIIPAGCFTKNKNKL